jgi:hypothetical protein
VLSLPGAAAFFGAAAVARLGAAMTTLAVLWAVRGATGSFAAAGVTTAAFALAEAAGGPQVARLVENRGQRRILPWSAGVFALAVAGLIAGALLRLPLAVLAGLSMLAGASIPQAGALSVMLAASSLLVLGTAALSIVPDVPAMFICYAVVGGAVAPILIPAAVLLQRSADPSVYTQAMTWMNSASAAGVAVAAPLTGLAIQAGGWRLGCLVTAGLTAVLPAVIMAVRRGSSLAPAAAAGASSRMWPAPDDGKLSS